MALDSISHDSNPSAPARLAGAAPDQAPDVVHIPSPSAGHDRTITPTVVTCVRRRAREDANFAGTALCGAADLERGSVDPTAVIGASLRSKCSSCGTRSCGYVNTGRRR